MKAKRFFSVIPYIILACLLSCQKEETGIDEKRPVTFTSSVIRDNNGITRASGTAWSANDAIGIFMKKNGLDLHQDNILNNASNIKYVTPQGNQQFTPDNVSQAISFPTGETVDFIAYYPYQENITGYIYKVDVADQSTIEKKEKADLLYSVNAVGKSSATPFVDMTFTHELAKLVFTISTENAIASLEGLTITVSGTKTKADFNLVNGKLIVDDSSIGRDITALTTVSSDKLTATGEAIILPSQGGSSVIISFRLPDGSEFKHTIPTNKNFEKGQNYKYEIVLKI